ncbi:MAG TPA: hypothetical protein VKR59_07765 [Terriglobales bacterium]|nr:hypothetical protein [Terriglobales bacterium]
MRRCIHESYLPKNCKALSPYCGQCNPGLAIKDARAVVLPLHGIGHPEKRRANGRNSGECCPSCGSEIYAETKERSRKVECADCGVAYRRKNLRMESTQ